MKLIIVRHGDPDYVTDSLTEKGRREAEALAKRVKNWDMAGCYVSPLGRAKETCAICLKDLDIEATVFDWLQEFYFRILDPETGESRIAWDFMPRYFCPNDELHDRNIWPDSDVMRTGQLRQHFDAVTKEFDKFLSGLGYERMEGGVYRVREHNDGNYVFFCHFGLMSVLTGYLTGIAAPALWQGFFCAPTGITVIGTEEREPGYAAFRVQYFGDASHLADEGEPLSASGYFTNMFDDRKGVLS